jgi:hypothetical protein
MVGCRLGVMLMQRPLQHNYNSRDVKRGVARLPGQCEPVDNSGAQRPAPSVREDKLSTSGRLLPSSSPVDSACPFASDNTGTGAVHKALRALFGIAKKGVRVCHATPVVFEVSNSSVAVDGARCEVF